MIGKKTKFCFFFLMELSLTFYISCQNQRLWPPCLHFRGGGHVFLSLWPSEALPLQGSSHLLASYHILPLGLPGL